MRQRIADQLDDGRLFGQLTQVQHFVQHIVPILAQCALDKVEQAIEILIECQPPLDRMVLGKGTVDSLAESGKQRVACDAVDLTAGWILPGERLLIEPPFRRQP